MPGRKDGLLVIYPEYFDNALSKGDGRRVGKALSVEAPTIQAIFESAKRLGLDPRIEEKRHFPGRWSDRRGRILVVKNGKKSAILRKVAKGLPTAISVVAAAALQREKLREREQAMAARGPKKGKTGRRAPPRK